VLCQKLWRGAAWQARTRRIINWQIMLNAAGAPPRVEKDGDPGKGTRWDPRKVAVPITLTPP